MRTLAPVSRNRHRPASATPPRPYGRCLRPSHRSLPSTPTKHQPHLHHLRDGPSALLSSSLADALILLWHRRTRRPPERPCPHNLMLDFHVYPPEPKNQTKNRLAMPSRGMPVRAGTR